MASRVSRESVLVVFFFVCLLAYVFACLVGQLAELLLFLVGSLRSVWLGLLWFGLAGFLLAYLFLWLLVWLVG